jgi:hypothetical protein
MTDNDKFWSLFWLLFWLGFALLILTGILTFHYKQAEQLMAQGYEEVWDDRAQRKMLRKVK